MRKNYKDSLTYKYLTSDAFPAPGNVLPPVSRLIREGSGGNCPHCHSTTSKKYLLFGERYCINVDCIYHYFDLNKDSKRFKDKNQLRDFITKRERSDKIKNII